MYIRYSIIGTVLFCFSMSIHAATGEILDNEIAAGADVSVLRAEAQVFESIRKGIVLSITECELEESCVLNVNRVELQQIVEKLDARITSLAIRHSESDEADLEDILLSYADTRDGYNVMLEKLATLSVVNDGESETVIEDDIFSDIDQDAAGTENTEENYNKLFEDIDEEL